MLLLLVALMVITSRVIMCDPTQTELTANRCHFTQQSKLIQTGQTQTFEKTNILKIFRNLIELNYNYQLPSITLDKTVIKANLQNCLTYGRPFKLNEHFKTYDGKVILDMFLVKIDNADYFCIIEGVYKAKNECLTEIKTISKINKVPIPAIADEPYAEAFLNIFKFSNSKTLILTYKTKFDFLGQNDQVICRDVKYKTLSGLREGLQSQLKTPIATIFNFIKPLLHKSQPQKFFITNNKIFFDQWENIHHYPQLLAIFLKGEEKYFPTFIYDTNKIPDVIPKEIFLYASLFEILKKRNKRSLLGYILNGDKYDQISKNQNIFLQNFKIMRKNENRLLNGQKQFSAASHIITLNEQKIGDTLKDIIGKLFQLNIEVHQVYKMVISDLWSLTDANKIKHLMNLINLFDQEIHNYLKNIVSMGVGKSSCSLKNDNVICQDSHPTFEITTDLSFTYRSNIFHFKDIFQVHCLPFGNRTFQAENTELIFQNGSYKDIQTNQIFQVSCFQYPSLCQESYFPAKYAIFDRCNFIYSQTLIFLNCYMRTKIVTKSKQNIYITDEPYTLKYSDFPITFQDQTFDLQDIFIEITDTLGSHDIIEEDEMNDTNTINMVSEKSPTLQNASFDPSFDLEKPIMGTEIHLNTVLTSISSCLGLILIIIIIVFIWKNLKTEHKSLCTKFLNLFISCCVKNKTQTLTQDDNETGREMTDMATSPIHRPPANTTTNSTQAVPNQ